MEYPVDHPRFASRNLVVAAPVLRKPRLIVDGVEQEPSGREYTVSDDSGVPAQLQLKVRVYDPAPQLIVDGGDPIDLAEPMPWYAYVFALIPFGLMFLGGAIGGALGGAAAVVNLSVFRMELPLGLKILASMAVTAVAGVSYLFLAVLLQLLLAG